MVRFRAAELALIGFWVVGTAAPLRADQSPAYYGPPNTVQTTVTPKARRILRKHKATLEHGILRGPGPTEKYDLSGGSGKIYATVHPKDSDALAVGLYDRGRRYAALRIGFDSFGIAIVPFDLAEADAANLFPPDDVKPQSDFSFKLDTAGVLPSTDTTEGYCQLVFLQRYQAEEIASAPAESDPCFGAPPEAHCDKRAVANQLRKLYVRSLAAVPGDAVGQADSEFLRTSTVTTFGILNMEQKMGPGVWATFDPTRDAIELPNTQFKPLWPKIRNSRLPDEIGAVVDLTAPQLAHELRHARQFHALGFDNPGFAEAEYLAYVDQALFLWARLEHDTDYEGMGTFNRVLLSTAGLPTPPSEWWKQPLQTSDLDLLHDLTPTAKKLTGNKLTANTSNDWFFARSLAGGLSGMEANLNWAHSLGLSIYALPKDFLADRAAATRKSIEQTRACLTMNPPTADRSYVETQLRFLQGRLRLYTEPARFERLLEYYRRERAWQQAEIDRRLGPR